MTTAGRLEAEFKDFKAKVEERLAALEKGSSQKKKEEKKEKNTNVVIETDKNDIVAFEFDN